MEIILILILAVYLLLVLFVVPIYAVVKLRSLQKLTDRLADRLANHEHEFQRIRSAKAPATPMRQAAPVQAPVLPILQSDAPEGWEKPVVHSPLPTTRSAPQPPPVPVSVVEPPEPKPPREVRPTPPQVTKLSEPINWEQFMGAKLFAWLGGFALFLAMAFFIKYSFDHDLIPPAVRMAIGFVIGAGLVVGGLKIPRAKYAITSQTLIAAGIVSLYAVTFACRAIYRFEFFGPVPTFLLMSLITASAFILAVRLNAQTVAILGILGGFLTPILLSTGSDNPTALFGYIALLDLGLVAVALHRRWFYLVTLGTVGTAIMIIGWAAKFYVPDKAFTAMTVCVGFCALFFAASHAARYFKRESPVFGWTSIVFQAIAFCFAWHFLADPQTALLTVLVFGFILVVSTFVFAVAWFEGKGFLVACGAAATISLIVRWIATTGSLSQMPEVVIVCLAFCGVYFAAYLFARRWHRATPPVLWAAVGLPGATLVIALFLMHHFAAWGSPLLFFIFILASDGFLLSVAWLDRRVPKLHLVAGMSVFGILSLWIALYLTAPLLPWGLAVALVFAALHTAFPLVLERRQPTASPSWWSQLFPPLTLLLMLLPIFKLETVSLLLWPAILLVDIIAIALAIWSASLIAVIGVLLLTFAAAGLTIFRLPSAGTLDFSMLLIVGGFAVFFFVASLWLARKFAAAKSSPSYDLATCLPAFASLLPFLLLIMACARLFVPNPSAVFGLGLLLVMLALGLVVILLRQSSSQSSDTSSLVGVSWLPAVALAGLSALELVWHTRHFQSSNALLPLTWYGGFFVIFAVYPFLFRRLFARFTGPWAVAAMSGLAQFWIVYQAIKSGWPSILPFIGAIPTAFAIPAVASLFLVLRIISSDNPKRLNQLAWFGGVALFFITLALPTQLDRQWLTVAWSLEGVALLWLFLRVPHPGLRATGFVLLCIVFIRLALNPAVLGYHVRGDTPILNWYLYAYGLAIVALCLGARLLAPPRELIFGVNGPALLNALAAILAFLLLNLQISDFFTAPGAYVHAFQFSGNFARDMSYTIGWALFALGLLSAGIWQRAKAARYAGIALLSVALIKLFFHDLAQLEALYRIGALVAVAVIAILASFVYQRFLPSNERPPS